MWEGLVERIRAAILTVVIVVALAGTVQWVPSGMPSEWPKPTAEEYVEYEPVDRWRGHLIWAVVEFDELTAEERKRISEG